MDWTIVVTTLGTLAGVGLGVLLNSRSARRQAASAYRRETLQKIYTEYMAGFYDYQLVLDGQIRSNVRNGKIDVARVQEAADKFADLSRRTQGLTLIYDDEVPGYVKRIGHTVGIMYAILVRPTGLDEWGYSNYASLAEEQGNELTTAMRVSLDLERVPTWWRRFQEWRLERKYPSKISVEKSE